MRSNFALFYTLLALAVLVFVPVDARAVSGLKAGTGSPTTSKKATSTPTIKQSQKVLSIPKRKTNVAVQSPLSQFCQDLLAECYNVALSNVPSGLINVQHVCKQNGKGSYSYTFQCIVNGQDVTKQVMNALGGGMTFTTTQVFTQLTSTTVSTTQVSGASTTATYQATTSISTDSLTSTTATVTTPTTISTTISVTTATPVTLTTVFSTTLTSTLPSTVTQTQTSTIVTLGTTAVQMLHVAVATVTPAQRRNGKNEKRYRILGFKEGHLERRLVNTDKSAFCKSFSSTCTTQCSSIRSKSLLTYCHAGSADTFTLACICTNGKDVTQQVLVAEAEKPTIKTISTISTQTSTLIASFTSTSTQTFSTTVTQTSVQTIPTTLTLTSTATTVVPVTITSSFTTPTTDSTQSTTATLLTTVYTPVATATASLTTKLVLAPTGFIGVFSPDSSTSYGVAQMSSNIQGWLSPSSLDPAQAAGVTFMAVQDPVSGLYQLQTVDGSQNVLIAVTAYQAQTDFEPSSFNSAYLQIDRPNVCGAASQGAAPADGSDSLSQQPCETFIFQATQDQNTFNATNSPTLQLSSLWTNPSSASSATYSPTFGVEDGYTVIGMTSNVTAFDTFYADNIAPISLRFPD